MHHPVLMYWITWVVAHQQLVTASRPMHYVHIFFSKILYFVFWLEYIRNDCLEYNDWLEWYDWQEYLNYWNSRWEISRSLFCPISFNFKLPWVSFLKYSMFRSLRIFCVLLALLYCTSVCNKYLSLSLIILSKKGGGILLLFQWRNQFIRNDRYAVFNIRPFK